MGEVYRARDTRLDRTVAVKVLSGPVSAAARERFEREARAVSSLNHPNICALYDVGRQDGIDFLVMEYLEGETLAARLSKGPLPVDQALGHAGEIARALDHAHRNGVTHRDLKPGNIMLTKSGVKVLDFGLAKIAHSTGPDDKTLDAGPLTAEGAILGTVQYMAPEQIESRKVDPRTDIFAFGAVLYEMLSGRKAFSGQSQASLIAAILEHEPPRLSQAQPLTPPLVEHLVVKCLAKDPEARWQSALDLEEALRWGALASRAEVAPDRRGRLYHRAATAALLAALAFLGIAYWRRAPPQQPVLRFAVYPPEKTSFPPLTIGGPSAISPDGRQLAFVAGARQLLWVRPLDSLEARPLAGTEGAEHPFWSPDGGSIGFFAMEKLKTIEASGGSLRSLCEARQGRGGAWSPHGVIVFGSFGAGGGLTQVPAAGGDPTSATTLGPSEVIHRWPQFLPDGRHFLFFAGTGRPETRGVFLGSLGSKSTRRVLTANTQALYAGSPAGSGYLLFVREGTLRAQPFDPKSLQTTAEPLIVAGAGPVAEIGGTGFAGFSASREGVLVYTSGFATPSQLTWFDRTGKPLGVIGDPGNYRQPRLSPDEEDPGGRALRSDHVGNRHLALGSHPRRCFALHLPPLQPHLVPGREPPGVRLQPDRHPSALPKTIQRRRPGGAASGVQPVKHRKRLVR